MKSYRDRAFDACVRSGADGHIHSIEAVDDVLTVVSRGKMGVAGGHRGVLPGPTPSGKDLESGTALVNGDGVYQAGVRLPSSIRSSRRAALFLLRGLLEESKKERSFSPRTWL
jgi:hypothetical protein